MSSSRQAGLLTRRQWMMAAGAGLALRRPVRSAPTAPVALARCRQYGPDLTPTLARMFDQLGGLGRLVAGKTVAMKVNLTGNADNRFGHEPHELSYWTHPDVIGATVHLLGRAGARRIRILESVATGTPPLEEEMWRAGWDVDAIANAAPKVEFENTSYLGSGKEYKRLMTPCGGHIYPGFDFNHSYVDCDFFVSIAKLKEHVTAGVTLSLKNCFGSTPNTIYGDAAGEDEPALIPNGGRGRVFHRGIRQPSKSAPQENDPATPRDDQYRVPRIVADICAARPIHLAIIEGIETMYGGEGPWTRRWRTGRISPGILIAGLNPVTTDAVGMACMGYDPMAGRGAVPFETCDNTLALAEELGAGTRDLNNIEVTGERISALTYPFPRAKAAG